MIPQIAKKIKAVLILHTVSGPVRKINTRTNNIIKTRKQRSGFPFLNVLSLLFINNHLAFLDLLFYWQIRYYIQIWDYISCD